MQQTYSSTTDCDSDIKVQEFIHAFIRRAKDQASIHFVRSLFNYESMEEILEKSDLPEDNYDWWNEGVEKFYNLTVEYNS